MAAFEAFETREAAAAHVAALLEGALRFELELAGYVSLLVSGGSTPGPVFERLSMADLDWQWVSVGLVDERWVDEDDPRSNAALVKRTLLRGPAAAAKFTGMKTAHSDPFAAAASANEAYLSFFTTRPVMLLGMGGDGHTASWFPGAEGLETAMADVDDGPFVAAIDATGAPVAGDMPHRMTLTGSAFASAALTVLYITGDDKRAVLQDTTGDLPIHHAERLLGTSLKEVWAP